MKQHFLLILLAILLCRFNADQLEINSFAPISKNVRRIIKFQPVTYSYTLNTLAWNVWSEFPGLSLRLKIPFGQLVFIKYHIVFYSSNACGAATRLMVDQKQIPMFRYFTHNVAYRTHVASELVWLGQGVHYVAVNYRGDCSWPVNHISDYNYAFVQAHYNEEVK